NAFFSAGKTMDGTNIILDTVDNKVKQVSNSWKVFLDTFRGSAGGALGGVLDFAKSSLNFLTFFADPISFFDNQKIQKINEQTEAIQTQVNTVEGLINAYRYLERENTRINESIARETEAGNAVAVKAFEEQRKLISEAF